MSWNLNELRDLVLKIHGKKNYIKLFQCSDSIAERLEFAGFHYREAKDIFDQFDWHEDISDTEIFHTLIFGGNEDSEELEKKKLTARAHIVAFIQSLHSVSDILSHVIYYSLGMNNAKKERDINLPEVNKWLSNNSNYFTLINLLKEFIDNDSYLYLSALANNSKHRRILSAGLNVNLLETGRNRKEVVFPQFTFNNKTHDKRQALVFIESEYNRQIALVIKIGNELNRLVIKSTNK